MTRALLVLALSGCVTTVGIVKRDEGVGVAWLAGGAAADLAVTAVAASQVPDFSLGATLATALAVTAADAVIACLIGACAALRP